MADIPEGLPPVESYGNNGAWVNGKQYIATPVGDPQDMQFRWAEVKYRWVGVNGTWLLAYRNPDDWNPNARCTLDNARYFEGPSYRGDCVLFGNGLQELPDPVKGYKGSLYKFYTSGGDLTENYANFGVTGASPFTIDGVHRIAKFNPTNWLYTVTRPGMQGYNWGFGAFNSTSYSALYANCWSLQFRVDKRTDGKRFTWLLYGASPYAHPEAGGIMNDFGVYVDHDRNQLAYFRRRTGSFVRTKDIVYVNLNLASVGNWYQAQVEVDKTHASRLSVNVGSVGYGTVTMAALPLAGEQFDSVYFNRGPDIGSDGYPVSFMTDPTIGIGGHVSMRRFYINTAPAMSYLETPMYSTQPNIRIFSRKLGETGDGVEFTRYLVNWPHEQDNRRVTYTIPQTPNGVYEVRVEGNFGSSGWLPIRVDNDIYKEGTSIFTDFTDLKYVREHFIAAHKQWGGTASQGLELLNGGVVRDNIEFYPYHYDEKNNVRGLCRMYGHGVYYDGPTVGVDRLGNPVKRKSEVGACIATRAYLGAGRFRCRVRSPYFKGACTALWTFHYEEIYENDERWEEFKAYGDQGLHPQGDAEKGQWLVRNNEIDIEWPTARKGSANMEEVDYGLARMNSWQGEMRTENLQPSDPNYWSEYTDDFEPFAAMPINDGEWHEIGFDWHVDARDGGPAKRIDFYCDGRKVHTTTTHIPDIAGRLWLGIWYPRALGNRWAGHSAAYEYDTLDVDWIKYEPFNETMRQVGETYPNDVWRDWNWDKFYPEGTPVPPPYKLGTPHNDMINRDRNGWWLPTEYTCAGANPPQYIGPNRLEWRIDRKAYKVGAGECIIKNLTQGVRYKLYIQVLETRSKNCPLQVVTFEAGSDVREIPDAVGTYVIDFVAQRQQTVSIRRNTTVAQRNFVGMTDIRLELA